MFYYGVKWKSLCHRPWLHPELGFSPKSFNILVHDPQTTFITIFVTSHAVILDKKYINVLANFKITLKSNNISARCRYEEEGNIFFGNNVLTIQRSHQTSWISNIK
jgi:hypothetical protein